MEQHFLSIFVSVLLIYVIEEKNLDIRCFENDLLSTDGLRCLAVVYTVFRIDFNMVHLLHNLLLCSLWTFLPLTNFGE